MCGRGFKSPRLHHFLDVREAEVRFYMPKLPELCRKILRRDAHPAVQFIKYGIAGGLATAVHIVVFYICALWILPALAPDDPVAVRIGLEIKPISDALRGSRAVWNNLIAFMLSNLTAYVINILWVFKPGRHSRLVEVGMFYAVSAVSVGLGSVFMKLLISHYQLSTTLAFGAVTVCSMLINYAMRKFVIFNG